ncbi:DUF1345 domain-containing protein [Deminuibacter soli]|uniref:DUF1345 domain-containing protein n=1 Tax=Deminuibacter soli TaxID=2291815 RepID=A0A3E1NQA9_9BACT|nr:DUF1345 domain-containing protein [Deminuibacter soli]RFM30111.1 DUF1345 domain-containing protein [Deminuibacter soli]
MPVNRTPPGNIFMRLHPLQRLLIGLALALLTWLLVRNTSLNGLVRLMLFWDVFAAFFTGTTWMIFFKQTTNHIRQKAREEDSSRFYIFLLVVLASFASMFTVLLLLLSKEAAGTHQIIFIPVVILGMLLSWVMVHTIFTIHYAYMYYDDDETDPGKHAGGLEFPNEKRPDYIDFAYFAFVIGMTFQVSDVEISARHIRRVALLHGLLSFALNTFVVALTVNLIAGLKS